MAMKHMKMDKQESTGAQIAMPEKDSEQYPYGLRVRLESGDLDKVGFKDMPKVGQVMVMDAKVKVISTHESASKGSKNRGIELQITHLEMDKPDEDSGAKASKVYPDQGK